MSFVWRSAALVAVAALAACRGEPAGPISLSLAPPTSSTPAIIRAAGLSSRELAAAAGAGLDDAAWQAIFRVTVAGASPDAPPVAGRVSVAGDALEFHPRFPLDPGRSYLVTLDAGRLPLPRAGEPARQVLTLPDAPRSAPTTITRVWPSARVLPENLLRMYIEFSGPMAREHGRDFLTLLDERGREVKDSFLALDVDFWSPDARRYTVFFDPGRVKRGILPNDLFGRALQPGHQFTLAVDPRWRDAQGQPLAAAYRHTFTAGQADMAPIRLEDWRIDAPRAGTRDALVVSFPKPLDHGLLQRALGVARGQTTVDGAIEIEEDERVWRFTPAQPWAAGAHDLVVLSILEDPMGNKVGRPFDIDAFDEIDKSPAPERMTRPFVTKSLE